MAGYYSNKNILLCLIHLQQITIITYFQKLQSILQNHSGKFGIIVSKAEPPTTFINAAKLLYIKNEIIIISISGKDLKKIVKSKKNLLECIEMKACAIKMQAQKDISNNEIFDF